MDSFEFNKIAGSVLGTLLFVMGLGIFTDAIFSHGSSEKPAYALPAAEEGHGAGSAAAAPAAEPLPVLLAKADPKKGEGLAKACATCHTLDPNGAAKPTGPNLAGVAGRKVGSTGFAYSDAMKAHGGDWTYDNLNAFITNPKGTVPGTKMAFAGEKDPAKRADIIAYLASITPNAPAMPK
jgi:cytochrome c